MKERNEVMTQKLFKYTHAFCLEHSLTIHELISLHFDASGFTCDYIRDGIRTTIKEVAL